MMTTEYQRGYNAGYKVARRSRYSERVHQRLLDAHAKQWEAMHAHFLQHGRDETYLQLREDTIAASRAVSRYCEATGKVRRRA